MLRNSLKQHSQRLWSSLPPPNRIFRSAFLFAALIYRLLKQALIIQKPSKKSCATDSISFLPQLARELRASLLPLGSRELQFRPKPNYEGTIQANNAFQHTHTHTWGVIHPPGSTYLFQMQEVLIKTTPNQHPQKQNLQPPLTCAQELFGGINRSVGSINCPV